jgi:hypothetical protein
LFADANIDGVAAVFSNDQFLENEPEYLIYTGDPGGSGYRSSVIIGRIDKMT